MRLGQEARKDRRRRNRFWRFARAPCWLGIQDRFGAGRDSRVEVAIWSAPHRSFQILVRSSERRSGGSDLIQSEFELILLQYIKLERHVRWANGLFENKVVVGRTEHRNKML